MKVDVAGAARAVAIMVLKFIVIAAIAHVVFYIFMVVMISSGGWSL